jgi:hypothetical protein
MKMLFRRVHRKMNDTQGDESEKKTPVGPGDWDRTQQRSNKKKNHFDWKIVAR